MKISQEIQLSQLRHMLIASYAVGWETGANGYKFSHPKVHEHWDNMERWLTNESVRNELIKK